MAEFPFIKPDEEIDDDNIVIEDNEKVDDNNAKKKKTKKEIEPSDIQFVIKNIRSKSYQDMAEELNLTKSQINRILMDIKKTLRENAKGDELKEKKVEEYITENLTRSGEKRTGKIRETIKNIVNQITSKIY